VAVVNKEEKTGTQITTLIKVAEVNALARTLFLMA
jgi:hypothetical protein